MSRTLRYVCLIALTAALAAAATVNGTLYDKTGAVVPKAMVTLIGLDNGFSQTQSASEAGGFAFNTLAPGRYKLEGRAPGFAPYDQGNINLRVDTNLSVPVFLRLGIVQDTIEVGAEAPRGVKPPVAARRVRVGGRVQPVKLAAMPRPPYPEQAKASAIQGTVVLHATIGADGAITQLIPASDADPMLAQAAADSIRNWRYQPTTLNGQPVETEAVITVNYRLK